MTELKVHSIFPSFNGEVCHAGQGSSAIFVRLAGCNLAAAGHPCLWCDTPDAQTDWHSLSLPIGEVLNTVLDLGERIRNVTITGGEPLAQDGTLVLVKSLLAVDKHVSIETNGTLSIAPYAFRCKDLHFVMDYKPPSAGEAVFDSFLEENLSYLGEDDFVKIVVLTDQDLFSLSEMLMKARVNTKAKIAVGVPFNNPVLAKAIVDEVIQWRLDVTLNFQLHKIITPTIEGAVQGAYN